MFNELLDALSYAGSSLDKLGPRPLRGLLAGKPREGLSLIPFSDTLGITRPEDTRSGRDVTDYHGLTSPSDKGWGAWGAGAAADVLLDPLLLAGGARMGLKAASKAMMPGSLNPVHHLAGLLGDGAAAGRAATDLNPVERALWMKSNRRGSFGFPEVQRLTGKPATHLGFDEADAAYKPWLDSLHPEEHAALKAFSSGPQGRISRALRGGGLGDDPFDSVALGTLPGLPLLATSDDVMREVVPYLDSALSRTSAPRDLMTYRLADRLGDLRPDNAAGMVGRTVSDPSPISTTISPWGRFYGQAASPADLLADILVPRGGQGGYLHGLSSWENERELLLPRNSPLRVAGVQHLPVRQIDHEWYHLDPAGKPIPKSGHYGGSLFADDAADKFHGAVTGQGVAGQVAVPDELMAPNWREFMQANTQGEGRVANVLLEALGNPGLAPHQPAVGRLAPQEIVDALSRMTPVAGEERSYARALKDLIRMTIGQGRYPGHRDLEQLTSFFGVPATDLLRSRPR